MLRLIVVVVAALVLAGRVGAQEPSPEQVLQLLHDNGEFAAQDIEKTYGARCVDLLLPALASPDGNVRAAALWGLRRQRDPRLAAPVARLLRDERVWRGAALILSQQPPIPGGAEQVLPLLGEPERHTRLAAVTVLSALAKGDPALVDSLATMAADEVVEVRSGAVTGIAAADPKRGADALLAQLDRAAGERQGWVAEALGAMKQPHAVPRLLPLLRSKQEAPAVKAAAALAVIGDEQAVPALVAAAGDSRPGVRAAAVTALRAFNRNPQALQAVVLAREDEDAEVVMAADNAAREFWLGFPVANFAFALGSADLRLVQEARRALVQMLPGAAMVQTFTRLLDDADPARRQVGAAGLAAAMRGDLSVSRAAAPAVSVALEHRDPQVRLTLAIGLAEGGIDSPAAGKVLLEAWQSPDPAVRARAAGGLGRCNVPNRLPLLLSGLQDRDPGVRLAAVRALGDGSRREGTGPVIAATADADPQVRAAALRKLREWYQMSPSEEVAKTYIKCLADPDPGVRLAAVQAMGRILPPEAVGPLLAVLPGASRQLRRAVLTTLGDTKDPRAADAALGLVDDPDSGVWQLAVGFLERRADPRLVPPLVRHLTGDDADHKRIALRVLTDYARRGDGGARDAFCSAFTKGGDDAYRISLVRALVEARDVRAPRLLVSAVGSTGQPLLPTLNPPDLEWLCGQAGRLLSSGRPEERRWAAQLLGRSPAGQGAGATAALLTALQDPDPTVRLQAAAALGEAGDPRIIPVLLPVAESASETLPNRQLAVVYLGRTGDPAVVQPLLRLLKEGPPGLRPLAVLALGQVGTPDTVEPLLAALAAGDPLLQRAAAIALGASGDRRAVPGLIAMLEAREVVPPPPGDRVQPGPQSPVTAPAVNRALQSLASSRRELASRALGKITNQALGVDPAAWREWWGKQ